MARPLSAWYGQDADPEKGPQNLQYHQHTRDGCQLDANSMPCPGARPAEVLDDLQGRGTDDDGSGKSEGDGVSDVIEDRPTGLVGVLSRVVSRTTTADLGPPPDGGTRAWITVFCAHLVVLNTWGFIGSFGMFQTHYVTLLSRPPSDVAWIGSIQVFLIFFIGTFTGRLTDAGYFRPVFVLGTALLIVGVFSAAQCTQYWQFFLAHGVAVGLGSGCVFCPTVAVVSTYFHKRRALVIGIVAGGTATGGMVFPGIVRQLLPQLGFAWTMRVIAFIQTFGLGVAAFGIRPRVPPRRGGEIMDWAAFRDIEYTLYALGSFFSFWGVYIAFFYIVSFSRDVIGMSYTDSLNLMLVINGVGLIGRIVPNFLADRLGPINLFTLCGLASGVISVCWPAVRGVAGIYAWTVVYGVVCGGIQSLFPAGVASLTGDIRKTGIRLGMVFTIVSFASLTGPPIAGAIISRMEGSYVGAQVYSGATLLLGAAFMAAARTYRARKLGLGLWGRV